MNNVILKNEHGKVVKVKMGFSITSLFFAFIPDSLRGNFKSVGVYLLVFLIINASLIEINALTEIQETVVFMIWLVIYSMFRNKKLLEFYIGKGYKVAEGSKSEIDAYLGYELNEECYL